MCPVHECVLIPQRVHVSTKAHRALSSNVRIPISDAQLCVCTPTLLIFFVGAYVCLEYLMESFKHAHNYFIHARACFSARSHLAENVRNRTRLVHNSSVVKYV